MKEKNAQSAEVEAFTAYLGEPKIHSCDDWYNCPDCPARLDAEAGGEAEERLAMEDYFHEG